MKLTAQLHPVPRLKMSGTLPPLVYIPTWHAQQQHYLSNSGEFGSSGPGLQHPKSDSNAPHVSKFFSTPDIS
jgi:hypothetical protein